MEIVLIIAVAGSEQRGAALADDGLAPRFCFCVAAAAQQQLALHRAHADAIRIPALHTASKHAGVVAGSRAPAAMHLSGGRVLHYTIGDVHDALEIFARRLRVVPDMGQIDTGKQLIS